ncbi:MAG: MBL fold metallo-hydrolase [Gemmatimonadetes bacterium]|nr:MBL fold metallo-hydrolase [Gemmatimonadota bacterium]
MIRLTRGILATILLTGATLSAQSAPRPLVIYFVDVEGGQATLIKTPAGEAFLIDAGFPGGSGTFQSKPGAPEAARDAQRILAAARDAGLTQIDHLMLTHYHADHFGGVFELAQLLPIRHFIDHSAPSAEAEVVVPGTQALYDAYLALRATGTHTEPKPGDHLAIKGLDVVVVSSVGEVLAAPLDGAGAENPACVSGGVPAQEKTENPRSTGIRLQYGKFRFLDIGDLSGPPQYALTCPRNLIGEADVYLIAHHGGADGADPAFFAAVKPRVAVFDNGPRKGAQAPTFATIAKMPEVDGWQLHHSLNRDVINLPEERIANLDESTSAWIKVTAQADGSFSVTNGRTGQTKAYPRR